MSGKWHMDSVAFSRSDYSYFLINNFDYTRAQNVRKWGITLPRANAVLGCLRKCCVGTYIKYDSNV